MSEKYFDKVPDWGKFEILADDISGRIPVTKVKSWRKFAEILEGDFFNRSKTQLAFRGHRRFDWGLTPNLGRLKSSGVISQELAEEQLEKFRRAVRGRLTDNSLVDEDDELWSVGQHHGLNTPLLDWTYSPFVALFFAFEKEDKLHEEVNLYRAVYVLNKSFVEEENVCPEIRILEPRKDDHGRLVNQAGLFTYSPYDNTIENELIDSLAKEENDLINLDNPDDLSEFICKIYIRNEDRDDCLRHLRKMNVHHASLFPDLIGSSEYCNILTAEEHKSPMSEKVEEEKEVKQVEKFSGFDVNKYKGIRDLHPEEGVFRKILEGPQKKHKVDSLLVRRIANELGEEFRKNKVIDWKSREVIQARIRNMIRVTLRKFGYPSEMRDQVANDLLDVAMKEI